MGRKTKKSTKRVEPADLLVIAINGLVNFLVGLLLIWVDKLIN